jgi:hypothetical protein
MKIELRRLYWKMRYFWTELLENKIRPHLFKIPNRKPKAPVCKCGKEMALLATNTGDGWAFFWECQNYDNCGEQGEDMEWYPFMFGAWCSSKDLERIGIEVV